MEVISIIAICCSVASLLGSALALHSSAEHTTLYVPTPREMSEFTNHAEDTDKPVSQ